MSERDEMAERIAAIEERLANLTVGDLPLAALQRKLETDWHPSGGLLLEARSVTSDLLAPAPAFTVPSLNAPWAFYGAPFNTPGYYKHDGRVWLKGLVTGGAVASTIFTLPLGYRPVAQELLDTQANGTIGRIDVGTSGVVLMAAGVAGGWISLDNLSFRHVA